MTLEHFMQRVAEVSAMRPEWRYGQVLFNVLEEQNKTLAEEIRGSPADPFHAESPDDNRVTRFWTRVMAKD